MPPRRGSLKRRAGLPLGDQVQVTPPHGKRGGLSLIVARLIKPIATPANGGTRDRDVLTPPIPSLPEGKRGEPSNLYLWPAGRDSRPLQRAAREAGFTPAERAGVQGGAAQHPLAE